MEQEHDIPRRATAYVARDTLPNDVPLVLALAAGKIPVALTCGVLSCSTRATTSESQPGQPTRLGRRDWDDAHRINPALDIHHDDPEFGCRFLADERPERGLLAGRNRQPPVLPAADLLTPRVHVDVGCFGAVP